MLARNMEKIYWQTRGTKNWFKAWITERKRGRVKISLHKDSKLGVWYKNKDIEVIKIIHD